MPSGQLSARDAKECFSLLIQNRLPAPFVCVSVPLFFPLPPPPRGSVSRAGAWLEVSYLEFRHALLLELGGSIAHDVRGPLTHRLGISAKREEGKTVEQWEVTRLYPRTAGDLSPRTPRTTASTGRLLALNTNTTALLVQYYLR